MGIKESIFRKFKKQENGSVIVIVALMMTILLGFAALVIDGGRLFLEQSKLQNALDAAALAGAQELPGDPDKAKQVAYQTILANHESTSNITISFNASNTWIKISGSVDETLTFAHALGFSDTQINCSAAVQLNPLTTAMHVIPLGIDASQQLEYGSSVQLKVDSPSYGNFGILALSGPGADLYENDLANGSQQAVSVGDIINTQTGNMVGPTIQAIQSRMSACPYNGSASYYDYPRDCPLVVLVPVYQPLPHSGNQVKQVKVVGFASFFIESVGQPNQGAVVTGRFIQTAAVGASSSMQNDYGAYGYRLVE